MSSREDSMLGDIHVSHFPGDLQTKEHEVLKAALHRTEAVIVQISLATPG